MNVRALEISNYYQNILYLFHKVYTLIVIENVQYLHKTYHLQVLQDWLLLQQRNSNSSENIHMSTYSKSFSMVLFHLSLTLPLYVCSGRVNMDKWMGGFIDYQDTHSHNTNLKTV